MPAVEFYEPDLGLHMSGAGVPYYTEDPGVVHDAPGMGGVGDGLPPGAIDAIAPAYADPRLEVIGDWPELSDILDNVLGPGWEGLPSRTNVTAPLAPLDFDLLDGGADDLRDNAPVLDLGEHAEWGRLTASVPLNAHTGPLSSDHDTARASEQELFELLLPDWAAAIFADASVTPDTLNVNVSASPDLEGFLWGDGAYEQAARYAALIVWAWRDDLEPAAARDLCALDATMLEAQLLPTIPVLYIEDEGIFKGLPFQTDALDITVRATFAVETAGGVVVDWKCPPRLTFLLRYASEEPAQWLQFDSDYLLGAGGTSRAFYTGGVVGLCDDPLLEAAARADYYFWWARRLLLYGQETASPWHVVMAVFSARMGLMGVLEIADTILHELGHHARNDPGAHHCKQGSCCHDLLQNVMRHRWFTEYGVPYHQPVAAGAPWEEEWTWGTDGECHGGGDPGSWYLAIDMIHCGRFQPRRQLTANLSETVPTCTPVTGSFVSMTWHDSNPCEPEPMFDAGDDPGGFLDSPGDEDLPAVGHWPWGWQDRPFRPRKEPERRLPTDKSDDEPDAFGRDLLPRY